VSQRFNFENLQPAVADYICHAFRRVTIKRTPEYYPHRPLVAQVSDFRQDLGCSNLLAQWPIIMGTRFAEIWNETDPQYNYSYAKKTCVWSALPELSGILMLPNTYVVHQGIPFYASGLLMNIII
jgi:hypothetical protein